MTLFAFHTYGVSPMHPTREKPYRGKPVAIPEPLLCGNPNECMRFTKDGKWEAVPAPWASTQRGYSHSAHEWAKRHAGELVVTSMETNDRDKDRPLLEVYKLKQHDPTWAGSNLIGVIEGHDLIAYFQGERSNGPNIPGGSAFWGVPPPRFYFLVEPGGLGKLFTEFDPVIRFRPPAVKRPSARKKVRQRLERC